MSKKQNLQNDTNLTHCNINFSTANAPTTWKPVKWSAPQIWFLYDGNRIR